MRTAAPAPPMSKPIAFSSSNAGCTFSLLQPWNMMSPLWPCRAIRPEPCFCQTSHSLRSTSVV